MSSKRLSVKLKNRAYRHIPILKWLPNYKKMDAISDLIAGITVGLTMMPQSIAYASLAGLTAQYGLYSSFMGSLIYVFFGTIREISIGITSLMALLTFEYTQDLPIEFVILLAFLSGCIELLMGVLNLGVLVDFISVPVTSGFTSATSIIIIVSQIKGLLGIKFKSHGFIDNLYQLWIHIGETKKWDAILGFICIAALLSLRRVKDIPVGNSEDQAVTSQQKVMKKVLWFISVSRNAVTVLTCAIIAYMFERNGPAPFTLSGTIQPGLPPLALPSFYAEVGNTTYTFSQMCSTLGSGIIVVPVVAVLANIAIAKAFSTGASLDASQEMLTLGICNIMGSFVSSTPTCGAFTRSAVSSSSGARTPMIGLYSGTIILLALSFLTPYFYYIPRSTLSAVLISAVMFLIEWQVWLPLWRANKRELFLLVFTLVTCLAFGVEIGLVSGVLVDILYLLYIWARPRITVEKCVGPLGQEYLLVTPDNGLFYSAVDYLRTRICKIGVEQGKEKLPVVLNCSRFIGVDYTTSMGIQLLIKEFQRREQQLLFLGLKAEAIRMLQNSNVNMTQYCKTEEEIVDMLFGEKIDINHSATIPLLGNIIQDLPSELKETHLVNSKAKCMTETECIVNDLSSVKTNEIDCNK